jgi:Flp pilus assembly protein TadG
VVRRAEDRRERGAVAVEFALVLPLLLLLVLGGIDWGYYFMVGQIASNAAREGARAGALLRGPVSGCTDDPAGAKTVASNYMQRGQLTGGPSDMRATYVCCDDAACTGFPNDGAAVKLTVTYQTRLGSMSLTGFLPPALLPTAVVATATMRREP